MTTSDRTGLAGRLDRHLSTLKHSASSPAPLEQVKEASSRWQKRRAAMQATRQLDRRRIRNIVEKLKDGSGAEIPLSDIRLALFTMREEEAFKTSTIARHRLVSEAIERPGKTPLNIVFKAFFHSFERGSQETDRIHAHLRKNEALLRTSSQSFVRNTGFFGKDYGLETIVNNVDLRNPVRSLSRLGLKEEWQDSLYGIAIKCTLIERTLAHVDLDPLPLKTILGWIELGDRKNPSLESAYYEILLSRFAAEDPSPDVQRTIARFLLGHFGDPRITTWPKLREDTGRLKRDVCIGIMERWLDSGLLRHD